MAEVQTKVTSHTEKPLDTDTRDALTEGLVELLKPAVDEIDERVKCVR